MWAKLRSLFHPNNGADDTSRATAASSSGSCVDIMNCTRNGADRGSDPAPTHDDAVPQLIPTPSAVEEDAIVSLDDSVFNFLDDVISSNTDKLRKEMAQQKVLSATTTSAVTALSEGKAATAASAPSPKVHSYGSPTNTAAGGPAAVVGETTSSTATNVRREQTGTSFNPPHRYVSSAARSLQEYELVAYLGSGTFAEVTLARLKATNQLFAIKKISKQKVRAEGCVERTFTERQLLANLRYAFLVQMHRAFQSHTHLYLVLDFAQGGDLFYFNQEKRWVKEMQRNLRRMRYAFYGNTSPSTHANNISDLHQLRRHSFRTEGSSTTVQLLPWPSYSIGGLHTHPAERHRHHRPPQHHRRDRSMCGLSSGKGDDAGVAGGGSAANAPPTAEESCCSPVNSLLGTQTFGETEPPSVISPKGVSKTKRQPEVKTEAVSPGPKKRQPGWCRRRACVSVQDHKDATEVDDEDDNAGRVCGRSGDRGAGRRATRVNLMAESHRKSRKAAGVALSSVDNDSALAAGVSDGRAEGPATTCEQPRKLSAAEVFTAVVSALSTGGEVPSSRREGSDWRSAYIPGSDEDNHAELDTTMHCDDTDDGTAAAHKLPGTMPPLLEGKGHAARNPSEVNSDIFGQCSGAGVDTDNASPRSSGAARPVAPATLNGSASSPRDPLNRSAIRRLYPMLGSYYTTDAVDEFPDVVETTLDMDADSLMASLNIPRRERADGGECAQRLLMRLPANLQPIHPSEHTDASDLGDGSPVMGMITTAAPTPTHYQHRTATPLAQDSREIGKEPKAVKVEEAAEDHPRSPPPREPGTADDGNDDVVDVAAEKVEAAGGATDAANSSDVSSLIGTLSFHDATVHDEAESEPLLVEMQRHTQPEERCGRRSNSSGSPAKATLVPASRSLASVMSLEEAEEQQPPIVTASPLGQTSSLVESDLHSAIGNRSEGTSSSAMRSPRRPLLRRRASVADVMSAAECKARKMEDCAVELPDLAEDDSRFPLRLVAFYAVEVALGLQYLHSEGFIYRDLKPENILMRGDGHVMLTDFGVAKYRTGGGRADGSPLAGGKGSDGATGDVPGKVAAVVDGGHTEYQRTASFRGTTHYMSPEMLQGLTHDSGTDWWSLGCILFEWANGRKAFDNANQFALFCSIAEKDVQIDEDRDFKLTKLELHTRVAQLWHQYQEAKQLQRQHRCQPNGASASNSLNPSFFSSSEAPGIFFGTSPANVSFQLGRDGSIAATFTEPNTTPSVPAAAMAGVGGVPITAAHLTPHDRDVLLRLAVKEMTEALYLLRDLVLALLTRDPEKRLCGPAVLEHSFFTCPYVVSQLYNRRRQPNPYQATTAFASFTGSFAKILGSPSRGSLEGGSLRLSPTSLRESIRGHVDDEDHHGHHHHHSNHSGHTNISDGVDGGHSDTAHNSRETLPEAGRDEDEENNHDDDDNDDDVAGVPSPLTAESVAATLEVRRRPELWKDLFSNVKLRALYVPRLRALDDLRHFPSAVTATGLSAAVEQQKRIKEAKEQKRKLMHDVLVRAAKTHLLKEEAMGAPHRVDSMDGQVSLDGTSPISGASLQTPAADGSHPTDTDLSSAQPITPPLPASLSTGGDGDGGSVVRPPSTATDTTNSAQGISITSAISVTPPPQQQQQKHKQLERHVDFSSSPPVPLDFHQTVVPADSSAAQPPCQAGSTSPCTLPPCLDTAPSGRGRVTVQLPPPSVRKKEDEDEERNTADGGVDHDNPNNTAGRQGTDDLENVSTPASSSGSRTQRRLDESATLPSCQDSVLGSTTTTLSPSVTPRHPEGSGGRLVNGGMDLSASDLMARTAILPQEFVAAALAATVRHRDAASTDSGRVSGEDGGGGGGGFSDGHEGSRGGGTSGDGGSIGMPQVGYYECDALEDGDIVDKEEESRFKNSRTSTLARKDVVADTQDLQMSVFTPLPASAAAMTMTTTAPNETSLNAHSEAGSAHDEVEAAYVAPAVREDGASETEAVAQQAGADPKALSPSTLARHGDHDGASAGSSDSHDDRHEEDDGYNEDDDEWSSASSSSDFSSSADEGYGHRHSHSRSRYRGKSSTSSSTATTTTSSSDEFGYASDDVARHTARQILLASFQHSLAQLPGSFASQTGNSTSAGTGGGAAPAEEDGVDTDEDDAARRWMRALLPFQAFTTMLQHHNHHNLGDTAGVGGSFRGSDADAPGVGGGGNNTDDGAGDVSCGGGGGRGERSEEDMWRQATTGAALGGVGAPVDFSFQAPLNTLHGVDYDVEDEYFTPPRQQRLRSSTGRPASQAIPVRSAQLLGRQPFRASPPTAVAGSLAPRPSQTTRGGAPNATGYSGANDAMGPYASSPTAVALTDGAKRSSVFTTTDTRKPPSVATQFGLLSTQAPTTTSTITATSTLPGIRYNETPLSSPMMRSALENSQDFLGFTYDSRSILEARPSGPPMRSPVGNEASFGSTDHYQNFSFTSPAVVEEYYQNYSHSGSS